VGFVPYLQRLVYELAEGNGGIMTRDPLWIHRVVQEALVEKFLRHEIGYAELDDLIDWLDNVLGKEDPDA